MKKTHMYYFKGLIIILFIFSFSNLKSQNLRINEFMALNETILTDEDGDFSDWIEIYNPTATSISLKNWALTDDATIPSKWLFPEISINAGEYLLVFASSKDRNNTTGNLHTNFNLKGSGEFLALINPSGEAISVFNPFPPQQADYSYGYLNNSYIEFSESTPGADNAISTGTVIPEPVFSQKHGFYDNAFQLEITSPVSNAVIYYTTDGSTPSPSNGKIYNAKITITSTTIVRAVTFLAGKGSSKISTQSYFYLNDVIHQGNNPNGYPKNWGNYTAISGKSIADYEMDPEQMNDPILAATVKKSLTEIPTISLVTEISNIFSDSTDPDKGGIYIYTGAPLTNTTYETGRGWERPVSVEYFDTNNVSFNIDCGIRLQGGHGRRPEKSPKHSFLLVFDSKYGPSELNYPLMGENSSTKFDKLILRAGFGNSWVHHDNAQRVKAQYQQDIWTKDTQRAMGHPASNSIYVHLYINGIYWGLYAPSERMDKDFAEIYMGGNNDDYDVIKDYAEVSDGNITAWNNMQTMANAGLETTEKYLQIQGMIADGTPDYVNESLVDVTNLADYMLINFYGGNSDWDNHNWSAMRNRTNPGKGFKFFCWDAEMMFGSVNANILSENNSNCPSRVYQQLLKNADFKRLLADRIQLHCFNGGALTPDVAIARWLGRRGQIENSVNAESARWGDYRRDVHPYQTQGPFYLYSKESHWLPEQSFMLNTYFPQRTDKFISQLQTAGLFPSVDAPVFYINGKANNSRFISKNDLFSMTTTKGNIYYTTDGSDPVDWTKNSASNKASLYSKAITLTGSLQIIARTLSNGQWSASNSYFYTLPTDFSNIKITEINYHPLSENLVNDTEFEFIELKNTGLSTIDLNGVQFTDGIEYTFPAETQLYPGKFIVIASNSNLFLSRYNFRPNDVFKGNLNNGGEKITLLSPLNDTISSFTYNNNDPWPVKPDGEGYSLVSMFYNPITNQTQPNDWRSSYFIGGSPGADDIPPTALTEELLAQNEKVELAKNFPNPFATVTSIAYRIPEDASVQIDIINMMGQHIRTLTNEFQHAGNYQLEWNGTDSENQLVANGIYFYKITVQSITSTTVLSGKMILRKD